MTTPPQAAHSGWSITTQVPQTEVDAAGNFAKGWQVSFITGSGVSGHVFVPDNLYNADTVRQMVSARVATIDAVQGLTEPPTGTAGM